MKTHGVNVRGASNVALSPLFEGRFGRMFRRLPACPHYPTELLATLAEQMREADQPGGWGGTAQPLDNPRIPAGYTYLGQFIDHDITFDPASSLDRRNDPDALTNFRTPRFDLDSLYGSGPSDEPFQYDRNDERKLLVTPNGDGVEDLPRNIQQVALIGDPRNDENIIVSQLLLLWCRLHNRFVDQVSTDARVPGDAASQFAEAQRLTRWHYQWVIVHDYLSRTVGDELMARLFDEDEIDFNLRYYRVRTRPYMPVEFSAAAFRFGHSQVRGLYDLNANTTLRPVFAPGDEVGPLVDLRGRRNLPAGWAIDWSLFFPIGGSTPQPSRLIDSKIVPALFDLPGAGASLALRNLQRGQALELPSGQDVARHIRAPVLGGADLGAPEPTPLWFYVLKEAELVNAGAFLGPVGGRIVAEVLLGLLRGDVHSYPNVDPTWTPTIADHDGDGAITMSDLVAFAATPWIPLDAISRGAVPPLPERS